MRDLYGCNICGDPNAVYRLGKLQSLCATCNHITPAKIDKVSFDKLYWDEGWEQIPAITRKEFYEDYLTSEMDVADYKATTTFRVCDGCFREHQSRRKMNVCDACYTDAMDPILP